MKQHRLNARTRVPVIALALILFCGVASSAFAGVTIASPTANSSVGTSVHFVASATPASSYPITAMRLYVDGVSMYTVNAKSIDTQLTVAPGTHYLVAQAWDASGAVYKESLTFTTGDTSIPVGVTVKSPAGGSTTASPLHFVAAARGNYPITAMRVYLDGKDVHTVNSASLDTYVPATPGTHYAVVQAWDTTGAVYKTPVTINVSGSQGTVAVGITPGSAALQVNGSQQFSASVSGTTNTAVAWSVNGVQGGNATVGTISTSGAYRAPASVPSGGAVNIKATSAADSTKSASANVSIAAASASPSISISPTSASVAGGATRQFSATVSGTANTGVNWLVNGVRGGSATTGTITSNGLYSAPACPANSNVTVTAQSAYDGNVTASSTVALTSASTSSNQRFVSVNGSDSNDGSACRPWRTIQYAMNRAQAGMTINVGNGTYNESPIISTSGTASAPIVIRSQNKWGAKIAPTSPNSWIIATSSSANYITVQDFELTDASSSGDSSYGIRVVGSYVKVLGNKIHHIGTTPSCRMGGAISTSAGTGIVIDSNWVYDVSPIRSVSTRCNKMHGMYMQGSNMRVTNNVVFGVWQGFAIQVAGGNISNYVVENNTLFNNGDNRNSFGQSPTGGNLYYECYSGTTCSNFYFANNLMMDNTTSGGYYCLFEQPGGGRFVNNTYTKNVTYNCGSNVFDIGSLSNSITSNPMLVNYKKDGTGDYRPTAGSPAVNTGTSTNAPAVDNAGVPRPQGSGIDIGAFEYR